MYFEPKNHFLGVNQNFFFAKMLVDPNLGGVGLVTFIRISNRLAVLTK